MTPDLLKKIAQQMRDDNPEPSGQMTAAGRSAAKAIHALADAMDKVADGFEELEGRFDDYEAQDQCLLCQKNIGREVGAILTHYKNTHPRSYAAVKEQLDR